MGSTTTNLPIARLDGGDPDADVLVITDREDRFVLPIQEAVRRIQAGEQEAIWAAEFQAVVEHVLRRVHAMEPLPAACVAVLERGRVRIYVSPASGRMDCRLGEELADIDIELLGVSQRVDGMTFQVPLEVAEQAVDPRSGRVSLDLLRASS